MARTKDEFSQTAENIVQSARENFLEKGFRGTSISEIASGAKVNKSLIYHHFANKEELWKAVKVRILKQVQTKDFENLQFDTSILSSFLDDFVDLRYNLYADNPDLARLMAWQRLDSDSEKLEGVSSKEAFTLDKEISELKNKGEIRKDIPNEIIEYLLFSLPVSCFVDGAEFLKSNEKKALYLVYVKEILLKALK